MSPVVLHPVVLRSPRDSANPFSRCRTCRVPFQFADDASKTSLVHQFLQLGEAAQIVGPHGTGKTTLAIALASQLTSRFQTAWLITIRRGQPSGWGLNISREPLYEGSPRKWQTESADVQPSKGHREPDRLTQGHPPLDRRWKPRTLIIIDGIERLGFLHRCLLIASFRRRSMGLIVTTHRQLPNLGQILKPTMTSADFVKLVGELQQEFPRKLTSSTIDDAWQAANGNCRQALDRLYDEYENGLGRGS